MCEMCEKTDNPGDGPREYAPIRLRCKTPTLADAFRVILTEMGAGLRTGDGSRIDPYVDGDVLVMPWAGKPNFVNAVTQLAMTTQIADAEDVREMSYGAMAQGMDTDVENVSQFGEKIAEAVGGFMQTIGTKRPPSIESIMDSLDKEIEAMQQNPHEKE